MSFMGMGMPELVVVMVIAFLALGPNKSIEMARTAGKIIRDLRRTFNEVAASISLDDIDDSPPQRPNAAPTRKPTDDAPPSDLV